MKYRFTKDLTTTQTQTFHAKLYDSLEFLKLSNDEVIHSILKAIQENPLLEVDFDQYGMLPLDETYENVSQKPNLKTHLYYQLHTSDEFYSDKISSYIIEALDERGFFSEDTEETCKLLGVNKEEFLKHLSFIQTFDPLGVAAFNSIDSLIIQSKGKGHLLAAQILAECNEELLLKKYSLIAKKLDKKLEQITKELSFIQTLNPYPCTAFYTARDETKVPELKIEVENQQIMISPIRYYNVYYNDVYTDLLKTDKVIKKYFNEAKTIIANLDKRNATLLLIANELVTTQQGYFRYGDELVACTQKEVADRLGVNQSTVSRATMNKYYEFNNEVFALSDLFVAATESGTSSDGVKKALQEIIQQEDKTKPFRDDELVEELKKYNLQVSRRTVSKYRSSMGIPITGKRKKK
ncbi:RNA polymerase factor sigma-54 [Breznakia pachnodae]|uniref:RNA polymerase sigma-54 factor n=1 Tax=Breznakia pachnodae TaxID=265178 RepID=A0ABU0E898_9FIRM|nr:RNA polymerase factor sigma-54 [Breznakia pachnodae]MDQ0363122.1 RNA polymerase sigma-54 factor [Breznakia pachnodae]